MTDDERIEETREVGRADGELIAIPDGGLGDTMPDWLRRPPAWRGMAVPDVPKPTPDPDAETATASAPATNVQGEVEVPAPLALEPKVVPEPDRSPIDPESLIELSDLPDWLVGLGQRVSSPHAVSDLPAFVSSEGMNPPAAEPATDDAITLRSQDATSVPADNAPTGMGMRTLVIGGVIVVVVLLAILIAQFG